MKSHAAKHEGKAVWPAELPMFVFLLPVFQSGNKQDLVMNLDLLQIALILWLIERVSIERPRYKLAIDTDGQFLSKGYWSIWIYHKGINETAWERYGGRRLIYFEKYVIPKIR